MNGSPTNPETGEALKCKHCGVYLVYRTSKRKMVRHLFGDASCKDGKTIATMPDTAGYAPPEYQPGSIAYGLRMENP